MVELRSDRLELRMLDVGDAEFVEILYANTEVTRTLLRIQRALSTEEAREFCQKPAAECGDYRFGAALRAGGRLIAVGSVGAHTEVPGGVSIGYSVLPEYWGRGLGTELAALLVKFAVAVLGVAEIRATTLDENPASARVLEKLGFAARGAGATEIDSRGVERRVTRWVLDRRSARWPSSAEQRARTDRFGAGRSA